MPAIASLVFGIAALQKEPGFFVAFLVQIMQQGRVGVAGKLGGQFVQPAQKSAADSVWGWPSGMAWTASASWVRTTSNSFSTGEFTRDQINYLLWQEA